MWLWWRLPELDASRARLSDIVEDEPRDVRWNTAAETRRLLDMMSPANLAKLEKAKQGRGPTVGAIYKRTRRDEEGRKVQRAEVRFDNVAGCLRTPAGGSSRQTLMIVKGDEVRTRLLSPREAARLMGLPDSYVLPPNYNEAYHIAGDGVAVPVVRMLSEHLLAPILESGMAFATAAE